MKLYSLMLGARNSKSGARFSAADERILAAITAKHFPDGFSILASNGSWWDAAARRLKREESREVHVSALGKRPVKRWAREVGRQFGQKEVMVVEVGPRHRIKVNERRKGG